MKIKNHFVLLLLSFISLAGCQTTNNYNFNSTASSFKCTSITPESAYNYSFKNTKWTLFHSEDSRNDSWDNSVLEFTSEITDGKKKHISGNFIWYLDGDYRGKEYFSGQFISETGELTFQGSFIKDRNAINPSLYRAILCDVGKTITSGTWEAANTVPGVWSASLNNK